MRAAMRPEYDFGSIVPLERVRSASICLLGCGAVGCNVVLSALQMGWRHFTLVDFDRVSPHNCPRSGGIFNPRRDIGKKKIRLLADYIARWDPDCESTAIDCDARDLGEWFFRGFDAVVCALDNMESVWHVGELMADTGIPILRGATNGWNSSVEIIENLPGGPCLCCGKDPSTARDLRVTSCGVRYMSDIKHGRTPALQVSSALCANRLVAEMTRRLCETPDKRPDIRYYDTGRELMTFDLHKDSKCACHEAAAYPIALITLPGDVFTMTLGELFAALEERIGAGATVYGADDYVLSGICRQCGESYPVGKPLRRVHESEMHCPKCSLTDRVPDTSATLSQFTSDSPLRGKTLYHLGFRICGSMLSTDANGAPSLCRLDTDLPALLSPSKERGFPQLSSVSRR